MEGDSKNNLNTQYLWMARGLCLGFMFGIIVGIFTKHVQSVVIIMSCFGGITGYFVDEFYKADKLKK